MATQITNAALMMELMSLRSRVDNLERTVEDKNVNIAQVVERVNKIDQRLSSFEQGVKLTMKVGGVALGIISFAMPIITLVIQHMWR